MTSSSLRIGMDFTWYFWISSLLRWALIILRLTLDGAEKCALRDLRRDDETFGLNFIAVWARLDQLLVEVGAHNL